MSQSARPMSEARSTSGGSVLTGLIKPACVVASSLIAVGALSSCGSGDTEPTADAAPVTVTETVAPEPSPVVEAAPSPSTEETASADVPVVDFVMPDLVGVDLQTAQNTVQDNGVFFSVSHDLLGSRSQMLDSNWIVCTQSIPAGERVTGDVEGQIDFGAVKREESCP
jgi:hypothetical protein